MAFKCTFRTLEKLCLSTLFTNQLFNLIHFESFRINTALVKLKFTNLFKIVLYCKLFMMLFRKKISLFKTPIK